MKTSGTLKVEIVKPAGDLSWTDLGARMRVLGQTLPVALNLAMRDCFPDVVRTIECALAPKDDEKAKAELKTVKERIRGLAPKRIQFHWRGIIERRRVFAGKGVDDRAYSDVAYNWCSETADYILAGLNGEPFKELMVGKRTIPDFSRSYQAFFTEGRACKISGKADDAHLWLPLWGQGKGAVEVIVAPCGGHARVLWEKLTRDFTKRGEISTLEQRAKRKDQEAIYRLEEICAVKLGKVGVVYNERKKKWYALITWTEHKPAPDANGQKAACNFGASNFLYVMAEDGVYYRDPGTDILALREQFDGQRSSVAQARRFFGSGAQGRGKKRRNLVSKKVGDKESRRVESRIRESASWLTRWCQRHNVKTLYIENLKGIRERFEQKTEGDAPENLKRLIHKWPYFETQEAIERSATKAGIKVVKKVAHLVTQRCPLCRHASPDNITEESHGGPVKLLRKTGPQNFIVDTSKGSPFRLVEKRRWFKCTKCAARGHLDAIACVNHLIDVGAEHAFNNMQEASRKRVKFTRSKIQKTMQPAAL